VPALVLTVPEILTSVCCAIEVELLDTRLSELEIVRSAIVISYTTCDVIS
jgi:hypothetical protein